MSSIFRRARLPEAETVYHIIEQRIHWMDENGISGWNKTDYLHFYPLSYFQQQCAAGQLYVLVSDAGQVQGAVILLEEDIRWADFAPSAALCAQPRLGTGRSRGRCRHSVRDRSSRP